MISGRVSPTTTTQQSQPTFSNNIVYCGRRGMAYLRNPGNIKFTLTVRQNAHYYKDAKTRSDKAMVVTSVVSQLVNECDLRFMFFSQEKKEFVDMPKDKVHDKVSHAIRDYLRQSEKDELRRRTIQQKQQMHLQHLSTTTTEKKATETTTIEPAISSSTPMPKTQLTTYESSSSLPYQASPLPTTTGNNSVAVVNNNNYLSNDQKLLPSPSLSEILFDLGSNIEQYKPDTTTASSMMKRLSSKVMMEDAVLLLDGDDALSISTFVPSDFDDNGDDISLIDGETLLLLQQRAEEANDNDGKRQSLPAQPAAILEEDKTTINHFQQQLEEEPLPMDAMITFQRQDITELLETIF